MFRFTIRDVLWLTVVVAISLAFAIERHRLLGQIKASGPVTVDVGTAVQNLQAGQVIEVSRIEGGVKTRILDRSPVTDP